MKKTTILVSIILVLVIIGVFFAAKLTGNVVSANTVKIGVALPLTGDAGNMGQNVKSAIEIAAKEINSNGGIDGKEIELIFEDTRCIPQDAANAGNKLINIDKVPVIIGAYCSGETLAIAPLAEKSKTILFSPGSSSPKITDSGDYIFRDYPSDAYQGKIAAEYIYNNLSKKKVAVLFWQGDWAVGVKSVFVPHFKEIGGTITAEESFDMGAKDLKSQLSKIKETNPDVIYFLSMPAEGIIGLKQAKELGINKPFVGGDTWDDPKIPAEAGNAADGSIFFIPYAPLTEDFKAKMKVQNKNNEIIIGAPNAYDALHIIADIMNKVGTDPTKIKDELYKVKDYNGVSGTIIIDSNGDITSSKYSIKQMKNKESMIIG